MVGEVEGAVGWGLGRTTLGPEDRGGGWLGCGGGRWRIRAVRWLHPGMQGCLGGWDWPEGVMVGMGHAEGP